MRETWKVVSGDARKRKCDVGIFWLVYTILERSVLTRRSSTVAARTPDIATVAASPNAILAPGETCSSGLCAVCRLPLSGVQAVLGKLPGFCRQPRTRRSVVLGSGTSPGPSNNLTPKRTILAARLLRFGTGALLWGAVCRAESTHSFLGRVPARPWLEVPMLLCREWQSGVT